MTTQDIMIDDWVYIKDHPIKALPTKVKPEHFVRSLVEFEPILLTKKILEENKFKRYSFPCIEKHHQWISYISPSASISLWCCKLYDNEDDGWVIDINVPYYSCHIKIKYLHELQHVLKLCNIDKEIKL
jgi:hypothetical protein